ncbi:MAG: hypothetical protein JJ962_05790 [Parvibaculum sp.]|nr:hypothetical protein [Parvibaculum sp.]
MFGLFRSSVLVCLLLGLPASAFAQEVGASVDAVATEAAAGADSRRARVQGDETFLAGHTCIAPGPVADTGPIVCEARINPVLPPFYFDIAWHMDAEMDERVIDTVSIRRQGENEPFQSFSDVGSSVVPQIEHNGFETIDVNFDGYLDFRLLAQTTAGPNTLYRNWLWSEEEMHFVESAPLDAIVSPEFDADTQEIVSRWRSSAAEGGIDIYIWEEGKPVLIHRETDRYSGEGQCTRLFYDRIGGRLEQTGEGACS